MTAKQAKKLLTECEEDYTQIIERLRIKKDKLMIKDFDQLLKFGNLDINHSRQQN